MRIHHILPYDTGQPGGVQTHTLALSEALIDLGHESEVFAPSKPARIALGGTRADLTLHPRDLFALRRFLRQSHDVLHIQEPMLPLLGPLSLLHPGAAPTVVTLHSAEHVANHFYRWSGPFSRFLLNRADAVICASEVSREIGSTALSAEPRVIHPCIDRSIFDNVLRKPDPNTILFVGRDEPRKGLSILMRALEQLPEAQLVVAGPISSATRKRANSRVTFLGAMPRRELASLMGTATCAAFPAIGGEALGLVLVEAMAAGVPVAASDVDGYRIASDNGTAALLSPPNDPNALAKNLSRLLSDARLRERLVERGRQIAERFDSHRIAQQHLDLYRSLL